MRRRRFVAALGAAGTGGLAGCLGVFGGDGGSGTTTATTTDAGTGPEGVYVQPFVETMAMGGRTTAGDFAFGLVYTVPHRFWTVTGRQRSMVPKRDGDSVHLMAVVWDPETGVVVPETDLSVEIYDGDELVSQEVIYPMLSQRMGFHHGANFGLPGDGEYRVTVSVAGLGVRRTGAFAGRFGDPVSADLPLPFTPEARERVSTRPVDQAGEAGAVEPMSMPALPAVGNALPPADALPGTPRGRASVDGAALAVTTVAGREDLPGGTYLAVSARTPYNRLVLPLMGLSATLTRDGETVYDGELTRTFDPELNYHYGAAVDGVEAGDELELSVTTPPQVARHEGYETAFLEPGTATLTL